MALSRPTHQRVTRAVGEGTAVPLPTPHGRKPTGAWVDGRDLYTTLANQKQAAVNLLLLKDQKVDG
ncbi:MAG: hypothetical protein KJ069_25430 [Anaerolineae bacterium]|nr:hypothetical protein [Anaerolineae bacterium]